jgi:gamma-glutamylcyclotransferase (GGCT)/AIG2-like uncharacterized protein YtfP
MTISSCFRYEWPVHRHGVEVAQETVVRNHQMPRDQWYFAYGSNLLVAQMEARTGRVRRAIHSRLQGYCFAFNNRDGNGETYANIVPDPAAEVWGVAYLCDAEAILKMDEFEGVADGCYRRIPVTVETDSGGQIEATAYIAGESFVGEPGNPSREYLGRIVSGARQHGLPVGYVEMIEELAG